MGNSLSIGILTILIYLPGCTSLKEKRSRIKPLITRLHQRYNLSVAEIDHLDTWKNAGVGCVMISNSKRYTQGSLQNILNWIKSTFPDLEILSEKIELY